MTEAGFLSWYPQFASFTPAAVLRETVSRAGSLFTGMEPEDAEEARRLYTAHQLTLYALAQPDENNPSGHSAAIAAKEASSALRWSVWTPIALAMSAIRSTQ